MKKFFSLVLALVMALSLTTAAWGAPVADTAAAQAALDAATDGTTIQLAPGVAYGALTVVPTANSNTTYECDAHGAFTDAAAFQAHMAEAGWHGTPTYTTTLKNLTIVGAEGATVAGFVASSGHAYGTVHDYVLNKDVSGSAYYFILKIENLVFENVDFTGNVNICTSQAESVYDGVTFNGCSFTTGGTASSNGAAIRYYNENNNGNVKNLTVNNCSFENCYQGVYTGQVNGITVTDCTFDTLGHNAVAVQSAGPCDHGDVVITENKFENVADRVIRFNEVGADSDIAINNNVMVNCGDGADEMIKANSVDSAADVDLESNYWDGEDASTAVVTFGEPAVVGITGGTWDTDMSAYVAPGHTVATDVNGNTVVLAGSNIPASAAGGAYYSTDLTNLAVYPACDLANYKYTLESYTTGASVAKLFDQKAVWATHKITGAKILVDTYVVATSADSANVAFVDGASITYLNTNVTGWDAVVAKVPTVEYDDVAKCGDVYTGGDVALYKDAAGNLYVEGGAVKGNVDGKFVAMTLVPTAKQFYIELDDVETLTGVAMAGEVVTVKHTYAADTKTVAGKTETTKVVCTECKAEFAFVEGTPADAVKKFGAGNYLQIGAKLYVSLTPAGVSSIPTTGTVIESAETFDAGIAMYVGMSVMAAAGSVVVLKKRED